MKTIAIIPCHNEAKHIADVVGKARQHVDAVWVIDDHSDDDNKYLADAAGATVISSNLSRGVGMAVKHGIIIVSRIENPDIIVLLDGDGQHDADEIPKLIAPIIQEQADIVIGQRLGGYMPLYRRFGNKVLSVVCNIGASFKPQDAMSGFWAISTKAMPELTENKWGFAVELLIKTRAKGWRMMGVPIKAIYHKDYKDNSTISPLKLGLLLLWMIIKWRVKVEVLKQ